MRHFTIAVSGDATLRNIGEILKQRITRRAPDTAVALTEGEGDCVLRLTEGDNFGRIRREGGRVYIEGTSYPRLLDAAGRFLRSSDYAGEFTPSLLEGTFSPLKPVCGMYFATHFYNFYHSAPLPQVLEYIEDLALWGMDVLAVWFDMHHYSGMQEPEAQAMVSRLSALQKHAKSLGIANYMTMLANEAFGNSPEELRAVNRLQNGYFRKIDGFYGVEICPSKEGGMEKILEYRRQMLEAFRDSAPTYFGLWPYDQGGCTCEHCSPWGSNGYLRTAEAVAGLVKEMFPQAKIVLSTWYFARFHRGDAEWDGLMKAFDEGRLDFVDYILADFPGEYPRYVLEHPMPRPLLSFNEISMYSASPWGAFGANPMPRHILEQWNDAGRKLAGGIPYSEGVFEDLNKAVTLRLFYDGQDPAQTIREYLKYECQVPDALLDKGVQMIFDMETTLLRDTFGFHQTEEKVTMHDPEAAPVVEAAAREINEALPEALRENIRWKQIWIRAQIDGELYRAEGAITPRVQQLSEQLTEMYYIRNESSSAVRPLTPAALENLRRRVARPGWKPGRIFWWEEEPVSDDGPEATGPF